SFSIVLMVVSVMFSRAVIAIFRAEPGFETRHVLEVPLEFAAERYGATEVETFYRTLHQQLDGTPLVDAVATASTSPLAGDLAEAGLGTEFRLPTETSGESHSATVRSVSQNYFSALDIRLVHGDIFRNTRADESKVVISQTFAGAFWPAQDPIGREIIAP